jgi:uncharacterized protein (DUF2141 family)
MNGRGAAMRTALMSFMVACVMGLLAGGAQADVVGTTVKDLSTGKAKVAFGAIRDAEGHLMNGTIKVMQGSTVVGQAKTSAGTYRLYDLKPGKYVLRFTSTGGKTAGKALTVVAGKSLEIDFRL